MSEPFKSQALEANLEQTRYKDIFIPEEHQRFINLSAKYFGINKRAKDCITEYHHPMSNHTFVTEELRKDYMSVASSLRQSASLFPYYVYAKS